MSLTLLPLYELIKLLSFVNNDNAFFVFEFFMENSVLEVLLSTLSALTDNEGSRVNFTEFNIHECENSLKKTYAALIIEVSFFW